MKGLEEVIPIRHREKRIVEVDLGDPGNSAKHHFFDTGLGRCGHGDGIAIATETGGYPQNIDLADDRRIHRLGFRFRHYESSPRRSAAGATNRGRRVLYPVWPASPARNLQSSPPIAAGVAANRTARRHKVITRQMKVLLFRSAQHLSASRR